MAETRTFPIQELNCTGSFCEAFFPPGLLAIVAEFSSGDSWTKQATSVKREEGVSIVCSTRRCDQTEKNNVWATEP